MADPTHVDWTRIAVKLQNEARALFEAGKLGRSVARYREACRALPGGKPALDALIHYGLAEALVDGGELRSAAGNLARSLRRNVELQNREGIEACQRLRARIGVLRGGGHVTAAERLRLFVILEVAVRSAQQRLRASDGALKVLVRIWRRPLAPFWLRGQWPAGSADTYLFICGRIQRPTGAAVGRCQGLPTIHLYWRRRKATGALQVEVIEDFGPRDVAGHVVELSRRGSTWQVVGISRLPA